MNEEYIKDAVKLLESNKDSVVRSTKCDTMTKEQLRYLKAGIEIGFDNCIELLMNSKIK